MTTHTQSSLRVASSSSSAAATQSLQLLLREDKLLTLHELHKSKHADEAAFSYAATLLQTEGGGDVELRADNVKRLNSSIRHLSISFFNFRKLHLLLN